MVNSAIGDHGNERHQTSPAHSLSLSSTPSLSHTHTVWSIVSGAGLGLWSVPGQARHKDRNHSCAQPNIRTVSFLFGIWPHISFTPDSLSLSGIHIQLVCLFSATRLSYPEVGGQNCYYVSLPVNKSTSLYSWSRGCAELEGGCWAVSCLDCHLNGVIFKDVCESPALISLILFLCCQYIIKTGNLNFNQTFKLQCDLFKHIQLSLPF